MDRIAADLAVLGAGPAGTAAAREAAAAGLDVVLLDQGLGCAALPGVRRLAGHMVWSVSPGFSVNSIGPLGPVAVDAPRVVAAMGAQERVVPFPGWTLPGVLGLREAVPGGRVVVAGCGPLLMATAARLVLAGATVVGVVDVSSPVAWLRAMPSLARQAAGWASILARRRVPVLFRSAVRRAEGDGGVERVAIGRVDATGAPRGTERWWAADALCIGYGLLAGSEVPRLLRAPHRFEERWGGWVPVLDADGRTGIAGLYAAGDGARVGGSAVLAGQLAGRAAAADAGRAVQDPAPLRRAYRRSLHAAVAGLTRPRSGLLAAIPAATIVCRCEGLTRAALEAAIDAGAREVNQLKHFTRCGMGACQGRLCADAAAGLLAMHVGGRGPAGCWSMRPPLRPVPLDRLLGTFDYADIPVPMPAPL